MNVVYVLAKLDSIRVCLNDMSNMKKFSELIIENTTNQLFDAVSGLMGVDS